MYKDNNDYGYLQHSTAGKPMRTERVHIKNEYARKIHVHYRNELTNNKWRYAYSTNAYRTCRDAKQAALPSFRNSEVTAHFAKD